MKRITTPEQFAHLKSMSLTERKEWLQAHADHIYDKESYVRPLNESEYAELKSVFAEKAKEVLEAEKEKKDWVEEWKLTNKMLFSEFKTLGAELRTGMRDVTEDIYEVVDTEDRMVYRLNNQGEVVSERKAGLSDLEQGSIYQSLRKQTA